MEPLVSYVCVTNRPAFWPAVRRAYRAQQWPHKELVVIDQSLAGRKADFPEADLYRKVPPSWTVAAMRNLGAGLAMGGFIAWLDDDPWPHPDRVVVLMEELRKADAFVAGTRITFWVRLGEDRFRFYQASPGVPLSGSLLFRRGVWERLPFGESIKRAADNLWLREVRRMRATFPLAVIDHPSVQVGVSHGLNISNPEPPVAANGVEGLTFTDARFLPEDPNGLLAHLRDLEGAVVVERQRRGQGG